MEFLVLFPDGRSFGPADVQTLSQWATEGRLLPDTMLENLATRQRVAAGSVAGIFPAPTGMSGGPMEGSPPIGQASYQRYWTSPPQSQTNGMAIASLVAGVISLALFCFWPISVPCALVAIITGFMGRKDTSVGMATAGIVCGFAALALLAAIVIFVIAMGTHPYWFR